MIPLILSGGSGTRLWPLSRTTYPKQFLPLTGAASMLQLTARRLRGFGAAEPPIVVCNEEHRFLVAEQLRSDGTVPQSIILEPQGRNTAPAVAAAAMAALERAPADDPLLLVLPSDHLVQDLAAFHRALLTAVDAARDGLLVAFGIAPSCPETGYGYIRTGARSAGDGAVPIVEFVEKPSREKAQAYLESGEYLWNSGMFVFKATRFLDELARHAPDILAAVRDAWSARATDLDFVRLDRDAFAGCRSDSIDYAVMEKTDAAAIVPLRSGWTDVGSWSALHGCTEKDDANNVLIGDVVAEDVTGSYVRADGRLIAAVGVRDHVIVETADAVLVAHKSRAQDIKGVVERLKAGGRGETDFHRRVYRPWGWYEGIVKAERFQVKHISVNPGAKLSLQMHHHRAEHWVVVRGTARVTCGDEVLLLGEDQSTYIPLATRHRLENPGVIPLELIEVQTGSYLGEDDIVRFEDQYLR